MFVALSLTAVGLAIYRGLRNLFDAPGRIDDFVERVEAVEVFADDGVDVLPAQLADGGGASKARDDLEASRARDAPQEDGLQLFAENVIPYWRKAS